MYWKSTNTEFSLLWWVFSLKHTLGCYWPLIWSTMAQHQCTWQMSVIVVKDRTHSSPCNTHTKNEPCFTKIKSYTETLCWFKDCVIIKCHAVPRLFSWNMWFGDISHNVKSLCWNIHAVSQGNSLCGQVIWMGRSAQPNSSCPGHLMWHTRDEWRNYHNGNSAFRFMSSISHHDDWAQSKELCEQNGG